MQRILVIGCSGGGKSTLARKLGAKLGIPVTSLDSVWWQPGWVPLGHEKLRPLVEQMAAAESWIIDGNFPDTFPKRLARADTVIWIDRPRLVNFARAFGRFLKLRGTVREEMGEGCPEKFDLEFARYIWTYNREVAPRMAAIIREHGAHVDVIRLRNDAEIAEFLEAATNIPPAPISAPSPDGDPERRAAAASLKRYWFEFDGLPEYSQLGFGCGVTAYAYDDALFLLRRAFFNDEAMPPVKKVVENVDVSTLDRGHVIPNMEAPVWRGVWFPRGYRLL